MRPSVRLSPSDGETDGKPNPLSYAAGRRILSRRGEPLFVADWERVLMIHFEVDAEELQRDVPFQLDLRDGRAFVSLVAFTMRGMRPRFGGRFAAWLFRPIATHHFLNVRTYVRHGDEAGIHFLAEWLSNWLATRLGPATFGLPYRYGRISYQNVWSRRPLRGFVEDEETGANLGYEARLSDDADKLLLHMQHETVRFNGGATSGAPNFAPCSSGSLDEWLMERYTAFNCAAGRRRFFRIWHPPWRQSPVELTVLNDSLLTSTWPWFKHARFVGANFSPGVRDVWMGRPQRLVSGATKRRRGTLSTFCEM
ncbi:MAG: DUF2071 domain-containing protein [Verrucomicrobia bacterium]|nr:DUF2071 domain-containing protein [Verrucomicrobiota bacterium]